MGCQVLTAYNVVSIHRFAESVKDMIARDVLIVFSR